MDLRRAFVALAFLATLGSTACGQDAATPRPGSTTITSSSTEPAEVSTTTLPVEILDVDSDAILAGVAAGSADGSVLLPPEQWAAGVRSGCQELPAYDVAELGDFLALFRIARENEGATPAASLAAVQAFIGGTSVLCPGLTDRLLAAVDGLR